VFVFTFQLHIGDVPCIMCCLTGKIKIHVYILDQSTRRAEANCLRLCAMGKLHDHQDTHMNSFIKIGRV